MLKLKKILSALLALILAAGIMPNTLAYESQYRNIPYYGTTGSSFVSGYGEQLTPLSRVIYDELVENIELMKDGKSKIEFSIPREYDLPNLEKSEIDFFTDAVAAFKRDHCECFWVDFSKMNFNASGSSTKGWQGQLVPNGGSYLVSDFADKNAVDKACADFENSISTILAGAQKAKGKVMQLSYIHEWLVNNNEYNTRYESSKLDTMFESYSAIIGHKTGEGRPVCEGYAKAFKVLCDRLGIPCVCISGMGYSEGGGETHMWNAIKLDGAWYGVDVTWDDSLSGIGISEAFFLVGSDDEFRGLTFDRSHANDGYFGGNFCSFTYPVLNSSKYKGGSGTVVSTGGMANFVKKNTYKDGQFPDVKSTDWFAENIRLAYELDLLLGMGEEYGVNEPLTIAQTLTIAARLHAIYNGKTINTETGGQWYDSYVQYCLDNGILKTMYTNYSIPAKRSFFADILAKALPASEFTAINSIADGAIPDVSTRADYAANVYMLYRAGILTGNDDLGTFGPDTNILRCQVAAIVTRMIDISLRKNISL